MQNIYLNYIIYRFLFLNNIKKKQQSFLEFSRKFHALKKLTCDKIDDICNTESYFFVFEWGYAFPN